MAGIYSHDGDDAFRQALSEARQAISKTQAPVEVACPHPDCERTATAPAPDAGREITVICRTARFADSEEVRCPEGHEVLVHYGETV